MKRILSLWLPAIGWLITTSPQANTITSDPFTDHCIVDQQWTYDDYDYLLTQNDKTNNVPTDFYLLQFSNSPSFCRDMSSQKKQQVPFQCLSPSNEHNSFGWVVHGLWGENTQAYVTNNNNGHPAFCQGNQVKKLPFDTIKPYLCTSPGTRLLQHEWEKHGTCDFNTATEYFDKMIELRGRFKLPSADLNVPAAVSWMKANNPVLANLNLNQTSSEFGICFTKSFDVMSCPKNTVNIASFNIQFLGSFKHRENRALASLLAASFDVVTIQELVAAPYPGSYPDGSTYDGDTESAAFFDQMRMLGFDYVLSSEDTGTNDAIHTETTSTEWFVTFFKPDIVSVDNDIPHGFLADDRSNNPNYERVPYATAFKTTSGNDFVLINVHLNAGSSHADSTRREGELQSISDWISKHQNPEKNIFVLGDMNFANCHEIGTIVPKNLIAMNGGDHCLTTNTNVNNPKPYDNILYYDSGINKKSIQINFHVINLIEAMRSSWTEVYLEPYPGDTPYNHNKFRTHYSDHSPVSFGLKLTPDSD